MQQSSRWAHLTLVRPVYRRQVIERNPLTGEEYVADTHGPPVMLLRCDCGHEQEILAVDFPGRRKMRYCGRPECPHGPRRPSKAPRERGAAYSVYLPLSRAQQVQQWAKAHGLTFSKAMSELVHEGLIQKIINED